MTEPLVAAVDNLIKAMDESHAEIRQTIGRMQLMLESLPKPAWLDERDYVLKRYPLAHAVKHCGAWQIYSGTADLIPLKRMPSMEEAWTLTAEWLRRPEKFGGEWIGHVLDPLPEGWKLTQLRPLWSKDVPTEPGWYWWKHPGIERPIAIEINDNVFHWGSNCWLPDAYQDKYGQMGCLFGPRIPSPEELAKGQHGH